MSLETKYNFQDENATYDKWLKNGYFNTGDTSKKPYCIVIPPPNVTGHLHLGHAWDNTLQDIIIRRKRMMGYDALYLPGMDHAGIATQAKIDEKLKSQGISKYDIGREKFLEIAWEWKKEYSTFIRSQWASLGISVDYSKERFTLDEKLNDTVNHVFISLYNEGLIYRGKRIINWDTQSKTALSNIEVIYKEVDTYLYHIRYKFTTSDAYVVVATTRPETCFADQALMVNPKDTRYTNLIGKTVLIPIINKEIPIISDSYVEIGFGTGIVKVTPAHDPNDYIVGKNHNLESPLCMNEDGTLNSLCGPYDGLDRFIAREKLIEDLKKLDQIEKIENYKTNIGFSERTDTMVEQRLSLQWFLNMDLISKDALNTKTKFFPTRFLKVYKNWLNNIQDWCISRQLWWGHRIPAWYKNDEVIVQKDCPGVGYHQDEDVLDTWFSSGLWPFSTLGWLEGSADYSRYFPTSCLVTGYDIIFFWVSRMIFMSRKFLKVDPFKHVLLHGLIRDNEGRKMSKSLGNGIDPIDIKNKYGMDSLRLFLASSSSPGFDLRFDYVKVESSWNFINKLWNITRYIELNTSNEKLTNIKILNIGDGFILSRLGEVIKKCNYYYEKYEFGEVNKILQSFIWEDFASWYLEYTKVYININKYKTNTKKILLYVLDAILKLLHPFIPFVTDKLYTSIFSVDTIMTLPWPKAKKVNAQYLSDFNILENIIIKIRNLRAQNNIIPSKKIKIVLSSLNKLEMLESERLFLEKFLNTSVLEIRPSFDSNSYIILPSDNINIYVLRDDIIDIAKELESLYKQKASLELEITRSKNMLSNPSFLANAKKEKIDIETAKYNNYKEQYLTVSQKISEYEKL